VTQPSSSWPNLPAGATGTGSPPFGATVKSALACGDLVDLTISVTSSAGTVPIPISLRTGQAGAGATTASSTDVPKAIPDNNSAGVFSNNVVAGSGFIADLNVTVGSLTHTFDSDLVIALISPAGTKVLLFNRHGGSGDNLTNTVFDDEAATAISSGAAPFTGSFRPFEPLTAFDGQQAQGTWKLQVADEVAQDIGTLNSWSHRRRLYVCS
jgi:subtilisin-like proprotein convertase family protein